MNIIKKPTLVCYCPCGTASGYGARSRDLLKALIALDKYDISVIPCPWGTTPMNALRAENPDHVEIIKRIRTTKMESQPDIWIQITVPNEFNPVGKYNIGITAGCETTYCSGEWLEGINRMNLVLVSSEHSKYVFENTSHHKVDTQTHQPMGTIKCETPIEVLHEGIDIHKFFPTTESDIELPDIDSIPEEFCFLYIGHWLKGEAGHDRKDVSGLLATFMQSFSTVPVDKKPALIIKCTGGHSITETERIKTNIRKLRESISVSGAKDIPKIYLLSGELEDAELNALYNHKKIKCFVSFTKGEGFGRPILEFALTGKPILVPNWSGQKDFINTAFHRTLPGSLKQVHPSAVWEGVIIKESEWFYVDYPQAGKALEQMFTQYKAASLDSKKALKELQTNFSFDAMVSKLDKIFENRVPTMPSKVGLKLPPIIKRTPTELVEQ